MPERYEGYTTGRPSDYNQETADRLCAELSEGKSLRTVCSLKGMPDKTTVFAWFRTHPDFLNQYTRAKKESSDAYQEVIEDLGDESIEAAKSADPKIASALVNAYKLKADNLKWVMSKMKPKKYGESVDVTSGGDKIAVLPAELYAKRNPTPEPSTDSQ